MHELPSLLSTHPSHPFHLSLYPPPSLPACLFPPLPPALSFPAKRLAGVFSTTVTFKTECHHCLSHSLSSLPLTCLSLCPLLLLCTLLPHPPILLLQRGPSGPSAVPRREAGVNTALESLCVGCMCCLCVRWRRRPVKYISDPYVCVSYNLSLTPPCADVWPFISSRPHPSGPHTPSNLTSDGETNKQTNKQS